MVSQTQFDTHNNTSSSRNRGKHTFRPVGRPANTGSTMTKITAADKLTFGEDFVLEHSAARMPMARVKMADDAGNARKDLQHSPQAYGFPC